MQRRSSPLNSSERLRKDGQERADSGVVGFAEGTQSGGVVMGASTLKLAQDAYACERPIRGNYKDKNDKLEASSST